METVSKPGASLGRGLHCPWGDLTAWNFLPPPLPIPSTLAPEICKAPSWPCSSTRTKQGKCAVNQALECALGSTNQKKKKRLTPTTSKALFLIRFGRWGSQLSALTGSSCRPHLPPIPGSPSVSAPLSPQPRHWGLGLSRKAAPSLCTAALQTYLRQPVTHTSGCQSRTRAEKTLQRDPCAVIKCQGFTRIFHTLPIQSPSSLVSGSQLF